MKISKGAIIVTIFVISMVSVIICAIIDGDSSPYPMLRIYLNDAYNKNEYGVSIYTEEGENITDSFLEENRELYEKGDMNEIVKKFASSDYNLQIINPISDNE